MQLSSVIAESSTELQYGTKIPSKGAGPSDVKRPVGLNRTLLNANPFLALNGALTGEDVLSRRSEGLSSPATNPDHPSLGIGKRLFDILFSAAVLLAVSPVLLICGLAVRLGSKGPIFFKQRRYGKDGQTFFIIKFRTMVADAESVLNRYLEVSPEAKREWAADRKLRKDPRVTRIGSFMRRFSIDELPQFWNVLTGDMSVVGPRPIVSAEIPFYGEDFTAYCQVRPGITGLWQVSGRNDTGYPHRVALDSKYVNSWTPRLDAGILVRTVSTVVTAAGAY
jgi:lipopolysaccharide/colanic/teichoic acid biosynthesis glycosyltransferase